MDFDNTALGFYVLRTLLLVSAFVALAWGLRSARRQSEQAGAQLAARLELALVEIRGLSAQVLALGGTLDTLPARLALTTQRPAVHVANGNMRGYEAAIRLARGGSSVEEIVASCGTTRAEAKLLRQLHERGEPRKAEGAFTTLVRGM